MSVVGVGVGIDIVNFGGTSNGDTNSEFDFDFDLLFLLVRAFDGLCVVDGDPVSDTRARASVVSGGCPSFSSNQTVYLFFQGVQTSFGGFICPSLIYLSIKLVFE